MVSLTTAMFSDVRTVFTLPPFFFSVEPVASKFRTQVDGVAWWNSTIATNPELSLKFTLSDHKTVVFCKMISQQKHVVLQSAAPLQLKRFKVGSKMAIAASAPVLLNQKKQCCKITRITDAPCTKSSRHTHTKLMKTVFYIVIFSFFESKQGKVCIINIFPAFIPIILFINITSFWLRHSQIQTSETHSVYHTQVETLLINW
jgi:hypothetical protein